MQIKIVKEFSLVFNVIKYRVWVNNTIVESFDLEENARQYIQRMKPTWILAEKTETIYTEEI